MLEKRICNGKHKICYTTALVPHGQVEAESGQPFFSLLSNCYPVTGSDESTLSASPASEHGGASSQTKWLRLTLRL